MAVIVEPSSLPASGIAHVLAIPIPGQGHLNPLMRLCKILASHNILITFVTLQPTQDRFSAATSTATLPLHQPPPCIRRASIAFPDLNLNNDLRISFRNVFIATEKIGDALLQLIARLAKDGPPVTCILSDFLLSTASHEVADQLNLPRVALFPSSQSFNLFSHHVYKGVVSLQDVLHASLKNDTDLFRDAIPGLPPLRNLDVPHFGHCDDTESLYHFSIRQSDLCTKRAVTFVVNSFQELEGPAFDIMSNDVPVFLVGPLVEDLDEHTNTSLWKEDEDCLNWLDKQPARSVLYISFGSVAILSEKQFEEIFLGLEASNHRFLWSVRPDLSAGSSCSELPEEFRTRTKDRGYTVSWAPQTKVLAHPSVGGFLTHCGWNSVIEAVAKGVPMLCWPYFGDQFMICKFVVEEWKTGMRFEAGRGGIVGRAEVERVVRALMEGEEGALLTKNVAILCEAGRRSLETGGSSDRHLQALVRLLLQLP